MTRQKLGCGGLIALIFVISLIIAGVKNADRAITGGGKPATTAAAKPAAPTQTDRLHSYLRSNFTSTPWFADIDFGLTYVSGWDGKATVWTRNLP